MAEAESLDAKVERALSLGREYLRVENGHLTRIKQDTDYWKALYSTDTSDGQFPPGLVLDLGETYCRRTLEEGSIQLHEASKQGWADDPAYQAHELETYHGTGLIIDDEPYGTVCFVSNGPREKPFTEDETMFAELISRMIEYELKQERTKEQVERLDQFASVVSHDLRNPLAIAQGNVDLARDEYGDPDALVTASRALDRMEELIGDVLALARQSQDVEETVRVSLSSIAEDCWTTIESTEAQLEVIEDYAFLADQKRVKQLFENIFRNAIEHGGSDILIQVGPLSDANGFYIENSGEPIPEDEREAIFESGFSTGNEGLGLGLAIVKGIVSAHGWNISVTDGSIGGPRFEITGVITTSQ
jgi:signal transduction histidine kinase